MTLPKLSVNTSGQIVNTSGIAVPLVGVNTVELEFGSALGGGISQARVNAVTSLLYCNLWRVAINTSWWLNNVLLTDGITHYQPWIQQIIGWIEAAGCYVEIDPTTHFSNLPGSPGPPQDQADGLTEAQEVAQVVSFFQSFIPLYSSDPAMLYNAWNEPTYTNTIDDNNTIINAIRALKSDSLIVVFARDVSNLVSGAKSYTQGNIILDYHFYDSSGSSWQSDFADSTFQTNIAWAAAHSFGLMFGEWSVDYPIAHSNDPQGMADEIAVYGIVKGWGLCYYDERNLLNGDNVTLSADGVIVAPANLMVVQGSGDYHAVILADGPIRYYRLGETSGTVATDLGSQAQNGTLHGGITLGQTSLLTSDPSNTSELFNGSSGYISVPTTGLPTGAAAISMECWINLGNSLPGNYGTMFCMGTNTSGQGWILDINPSNQVEIGLRSVNSVASSTLATNTNYHVVGTFDGTTARLYLNGILQASFTPSAPTVAYGNAYIGTFLDGASVFYQRTCDEVSVYSYALSQTQISTHYAAGAKQLPNDPRWLSVNASGQVVNALGTPVPLVGVNTAGLEFGDGQSYYSQARINAVTADMHANFWRVAINSEWWNSNVLMTDGVTHYRTWIQRVISWIKAADCYVEIDPTTYFTMPPANSGTYCSTYTALGAQPANAISSDTFTRANQSGWGTASDSETYTTLGSTPTLAITSNEGVISSTSTGDTYMQLGTASETDTLGNVRLAVTQTSAAYSGIFLRFTDANNWYRAYIYALGSFRIDKCVGGTITNSGDRHEELYLRHVLPDAFRYRGNDALRPYLARWHVRAK